MERLSGSHLMTALMCLPALLVMVWHLSVQSVLEIAQSQATGVWLWGKVISAIACLGVILWLITEVALGWRLRK